jgi:hypothetical protein
MNGLTWWLWQVGLGIDQFANTLIGGWADETLSARSYRLRNMHKGWHFMYIFINGIFFWMPDHCQSAYGSEILRLQVPEEER